MPALRRSSSLWKGSRGMGSTRRGVDPMDLMIAVGKGSLGQLMQLIVALTTYRGSQLAPSVEDRARRDERCGVAQEQCGRREWRELAGGRLGAEHFP